MATREDICQDISEGKETEESQMAFNVKTWKEDLTLVIEQKELYVTKAILAKISPVFDRMFSLEFKEKTSDKITLPDKNYDTFLEFLSCCYPGVNKRITEDNVEEILPLLDEYQVDTMKERCEETLLESVDYTADIDDVYRLLSLAVKYSMVDLKERCVEIASERSLDDMVSSRDKYEIPSDVHEQVLTLAVKRLELDVKEYTEAFNSAKSRFGDIQSFSYGIFQDCVPHYYDCGALAKSSADASYRPNKGSEHSTGKSLIKAVRLSKKIGDTLKTRILLKICSERSEEEIEEIKDEEEVKCLPTDLKDFILKKTSTLPDDILWS